MWAAPFGAAHVLILVTDDCVCGDSLAARDLDDGYDDGDGHRGADGDAAEQSERGEERGRRRRCAGRDDHRVPNHLTRGDDDARAGHFAVDCIRDGV